MSEDLTAQGWAGQPAPAGLPGAAGPPGASGLRGASGLPGPAGLREPSALVEPARTRELPALPDTGRLAGAGDQGLPLLPGFREMALRRMWQERRRLVADLTAQRHSAGLSQTEVAARMGTSQSAVARLEAGGADVRVSTLERYAAAIGSQISWHVCHDNRAAGQEEPQ